MKHIYQDDDEVIDIEDDKPVLKKLESIESQKEGGKLVECRYCEGKGRVTKNGRLGIMSVTTGEKTPCPACGGSGYQRV